MVPEKFSYGKFSQKRKTYGNMLTKQKKIKIGINIRTLLKY